MRHNVFRYLVAVLLIGIGVLLIFDNIGVTSFSAKSAWINLYPILFIVYGLKTIIDRIRYRGGSWMFGSFFLILGSLLMLDRFGVFTFVFKDVLKLWPLLIIYVGFMFIRPKGVYIHAGSNKKGKHGRYYGPYDYTKHYYGEDYKRYYKDKYKDYVFNATKNNHQADGMDFKDKNTDESESDADWKEFDRNKKKDQHSSKRKGKSYTKGSFFTVGDYEYSEENWKVEPMHLSNLAGDFYLDFTKAFIPETEIPISISALAGDVRILVPEGLEFRVDARVKAGDINILGEVADGINRSLYFETDNYKKASRKLDFTLNLKAGSIRMDHI